MVMDQCDSGAWDMTIGNTLVARSHRHDKGVSRV
jgi:hypothetical protein